MEGAARKGSGWLSVPALLSGLLCGLDAAEATSTKRRLRMRFTCSVVVNAPFDFNTVNNANARDWLKKSRVVSLFQLVCHPSGSIILSNLLGKLAFYHESRSVSDQYHLRMKIGWRERNSF